MLTMTTPLQFPLKIIRLFWETTSDVILTQAEVWSVLKMINEDKATSPDKTQAVLLKNSATYNHTLVHLFVIYSTKAYHLVHYPRSGNYPISVQSQ